IAKRLVCSVFTRLSQQFCKRGIMRGLLPVDLDRPFIVELSLFKITGGLITVPQKKLDRVQVCVLSSQVFKYFYGLWDLMRTIIGEAEFVLVVREAAKPVLDR